MPDERKPIGYVTATVRVPIYEGDVTEDRTWDWFLYEEPGITKEGNLGVSRRTAELVTPAKFVTLP